MLDETTRLRHVMARVTAGGGVVLVLYWLVYFGTTGTVGQDHQAAAQFESAFPIADALLGILLFTASRNLSRGRRSGTFLLVAAAGMTIYIGVLDLTFYSRLGWYWPLSTAGAVEAFANACCIGGGTLGLRTGWKLWGVA